jgi:hypothetical protein
MVPRFAGRFGNHLVTTAVRGTAGTRGGFRITLAVSVVFACLASSLAADAIKDDPRHARPPHVAPTVAWVAQDYPDALTALEATQTLWIEEQVREAEARREAERLAAPPVGVASSRQTPNVAVVSTGNCKGFPAWFPHHIIWRESNCTRGIDTGNGYLGAYQVARFHWYGGACTGLSWLVAAEEDECAWRLSAGGSQLGPWGA